MSNFERTTIAKPHPIAVEAAGLSAPEHAAAVSEVKPGINTASTTGASAFGSSIPIVLSRGTSFSASNGLGTADVRDVTSNFDRFVRRALRSSLYRSRL